MCRETLQLEDGAATLNDRSDHCHHCVWQHAGLMEGVNGKGNVSPHPFVEHFSPQTTPNTWWIDWHQTVLHYPRQSLLQLLTTSTFKSLLLARILHAEDGTSVPFLVVLLFRVKPYFWYFHLLIFLDFLIGLFQAWSFLKFSCFTCSSSCNLKPWTLLFLALYSHLLIFILPEFLNCQCFVPSFLIRPAGPVSLCIQVS